VSILLTILVLAAILTIIVPVAADRLFQLIWPHP